MGAVPGGQIKGAANGAVSALSTAITVRLSLTLILSGNCIIYIFIFFINVLFYRVYICYEKLKLTDR